MHRSLPIYEQIQATIEELGSTVRCKVPLNPGNKNHFGAVHAALQFAVCEMAGGLAVNQSSVLRSGDYLLVVKSLNLEFLKPALSDVEAIARISKEQLSQIDQSLREQGKFQFELSVELVDAAGESVAVATGVYYASRKKRPAA